MGKLQTLGTDHTERLLRWAIVLLAVPAMLWNLGLMPLLADEPTRAVVAQEMMIRDNYIVPTINGEYYYNKPPLYNWLLVGVHWLSGPFTEFTLRLPAVVSLALLALLIFRWVRRELGDIEVAFFASMGFVLMARLLIYDSLLGHIDLLFSLLIFLQFVATYHYYRQQKWLKMFMITYLLTAITFMLKGLPPVVFQGCTLLGVLLIDRRWKLLFGWQHILGGVLFLGIVGGYYAIYAQYNDLEAVFTRLWTESSQRTVIERSASESILHVLGFPFEHLFVHCIPFGFFVLFAINRRFWREVWANTFLRFVWVVLLANLPVYWLSPTTAPRYIFMLYPLAFILIGYGYYRFRDSYPRLRNAIEWTLGGALLLLPLAVWAVLWVPELDGLSYRIWATALISLCLGIAAFAYWRMRPQRVLWLMIVLVFVRFAFDAYVLPQRYLSSAHKEYRAAAIRVAQQTGTEPVYCYRLTPVNHDISFYYSAEKGQVLQRVDTLIANQLYLLGEQYSYSYRVQRLDSFRVEYNNQQLVLVRMLPQ